jgi:basic membrane protein A
MFNADDKGRKMKRKHLLAFALIIAMLISCTGGSKDDLGKKQIDDTKIQGKFLYIITDNLGDMGFRDNGLYGVQNVCKTFNTTYNVIELGGDKSTYEVAFLDACDSGDYAYIITCSNGGMSDLVFKYAPDYPDIRFVTFDVGATTQVTASNVCAINYRQNEGSFLAGVLAAAISKTNKIGAWVFNEVPIGHDFVAGYVDGARAYNPNINMVVSYGNGAVDIGKAQEVTGTMFDSGIDVIFNIQGSTTSGTATACSARGGIAKDLYVIGVDSDQWKVYNTKDSTLAAAASTIITSMLKNVTYSLEYLFNGIQSGTVKWGTLVSMGIAENSIGLADNEHFQQVVPQAIHKILADYTAQVTQGKITPKGFFSYFSSDVSSFEKWRDNK